jgi:hypothetical protein
MVLARATHQIEPVPSHASVPLGKSDAARELGSDQ